MDTDKIQNQKSIGIIGGGRVGLELFGLFTNSHLTKVKYVVDINPSAPALVAARKAGIFTYTDLAKALENPTDFIIEVTGAQQIIDTLHQALKAETNGQLITHEMAYIIVQVIEENNRRTKDQVIAEIREVKTEISHSLDGINSLVDSIDTITAEMNILALNARIEAARAGDSGKGFAVVASQMGKSADAVRSIVQEIETVSSTVGKTSERIENSLTLLK